jgi:hypothetical protein
MRLRNCLLGLPIAALMSIGCSDSPPPAAPTVSQSSPAPDTKAPTKKKTSKLGSTDVQKY